MNLYISKTAGFCYGVKRAVSMAKENLQKYDSLYSFGPIIHNKFSVKELENLGLKVTDEITPSIKNLIIRSHGVEKKYYELANKFNINLIDATCPFVSKIQNIVEENYNNEKQIVIAGNKNHPEVRGISSRCNNDCIFVENREDFEKYIDKIKETPSILVFQTTFNTNIYKQIMDLIEKNNLDIKVYNTICLATEKRQNNAASLAKKTDFFIVIGDKTSSNSKKLFDICSSLCKAIFIESCDDIKDMDLSHYENIGLTAGASTPDFIIDEVINFLKTKYDCICK